MEPVQATEAERAVVGAVFLRPQAFDEVDLEAEDFFDPKLRVIWNALGTMRKEGEPFDPVLVAERLEGRLAAVGGLTAISSLIGDVPTGDNAPHYANQVRRAALTRRIHDRVSAILRMGFEADELLEALSGVIAGLSQQLGGDAALPMHEACMEAFRHIQAAANERRPGYIGTAIATGLKALDLYGGLRKGVISILAGRPSHGKSSLARTFAANAAMAGVGVHVFSVEDSRGTYAMRQMADMARLDLHSVGLAHLKTAECQRLVDEANRLQPLRWLVDDSAGLSAQQIGLRVRKHKAKNLTELVVVDYVQLLREKGVKDKRAEVERAAEGLAEVARQEDVALLALSQLSRASEQEQREPGLSDLRETGVLEQVASMVMFAHRPELLIRDEEAERRKPPEQRVERGVGFVLVRKNKNGESGGRAKFTWDARCATYRDHANR